MELVNRLPIPAFAFRQFDQSGALDCVVAVRGTFQHVQNGELQLSSQQEEFQWEDAYDGDPHQGVLLRQTDLTPEKPATDITFLGDTFAPDGMAAKSWLCSLRVGPVQKSLRAHGKRFWHPVVHDRWAGLSAREPKHVLEDWQLSAAEPAKRLSVSWANAFGGAIPGTADEQAGVPIDVEPANPLGCGILNLTMPSDVAAMPAPTLTAPEETDLDWRKRYTPQGFGPISPWWKPRQQHTGTYDDAWLDKRHPLLPEDFDPRFWQCAPPDLIASPWLAGDEDYELQNLHSRFALAQGRLPGVTLGVHCQREDRDEWHVLNLDGVHFDWREDDRVLLTWRARFPLPDAGETTLTLSRVVFRDEGEDQDRGNGAKEAAE